MRCAGQNAKSHFMAVITWHGTPGPLLRPEAHAFARAKAAIDDIERGMPRICERIGVNFSGSI